ncbi:MAG: LacI family transcriptional regulator [Spirochaetaceae bacterium]|jgi:LacI family transcriptional regulator|nr:LacI family transcriptional regulator [Spirochaetaceae bacterium]
MGIGITQKTIAKSLGVSEVTVNRAFNGSASVTEATRKRVLDYAQKKGYVPQRASQALVRNKVRRLALFSSSTPVYFWEDIGLGVKNAAREIAPFNYEVVYHKIPDADTAAYIKILKREIRKGLDAAAFVWQRIYDMEQILALVEKAGIPYIFFNDDKPEKDTNRLCFIGCNYTAGGKLAANFIGTCLGAALGSKKPVLVISLLEKFDLEGKSSSLNHRRLEGFSSVMKEKYPRQKYEVRYIDQTKNLNPAVQVRKILAEFEGKVRAVYFIPPFNMEFLSALATYNYDNVITVLHDIEQVATHYVRNGLLTAAIFQEPILQGYGATHILENILEKRISGYEAEDVEIFHNLILRENTGLLDRQYVF